MIIGILGYTPLIGRGASRSWSKLTYYVARTLLRRGHEVVFSPAFDAAKVTGVYVRIDGRECPMVEAGDLKDYGCDLALVTFAAHLCAPYECSARHRAFEAFDRVLAAVRTSVRRVVAYTSLDLYEDVPALTLEYLAKRFDAVVFFNDADARVFGEHLKAAGAQAPPVFVVTPGVDTKLYTPGRPAEEPVLLYVGRNSVEKDPARLMAVLAKLRRRGLNARLVMVTNPCGFWPYGTFDLQAATRSMGVADSVAFVEEFVEEERMPELYRSARVFITLSGSEGVCLPMLEAQACGVPVVAQDLPSLRSVYGDSYVRVAREGSFHLPFGTMPLASVEDAASKVGWLLEDEGAWREYSRRGLGNAARYDWDGAVGPGLERALGQALA